MGCIGLQFSAGSCSMLKCGAAFVVLQYMVWSSWCMVLQFFFVCCSMLQCVAVLFVVP